MVKMLNDECVVNDILNGELIARTDKELEGVLSNSQKGEKRCDAQEEIDYAVTVVAMRDGHRIRQVHGREQQQ